MSSAHLPRTPAMTTTFGRLLLLACATAVMLLAGCGGDGRDAAGPAPAGDIFARVMQTKKVRIGVKADTPPFGVKKGDYYSGFDIDVAQALAHQMGIDDVEFVPVTSATRSDKLVAGEVDMVIASMTITRYRMRRVDFSIPYFQDGQSLLVKTASPIQTYQDLGGHSVGAVKGSTTQFYMRQIAPDAKVVLFADFKALLAGLEAGDVDAISSDQVILLGLRKNSGHPADLRIAGARFTTEPYGVAVPQNQSRWRNAIDVALMELWENRRWHTIAETWFGPGAPYEMEIPFSMTPVPK